jgi:hypothetical protein
MAFAQGLVGFINNSAGLVREWSPLDGTWIPVPTGGGFVELLTAPAGTAFNSLGTLTGSGFALNYPTLAAFLGANPGWANIATVGFNTPAAGRFNGGIVTLQSAIPGNANAEYVIIGWTGPATTWDAAILAGAFVGSSPLLTTTTGSGGTPPTPATLLSATFPGMYLGIPEPTTLALVGLGAAALMIFRRRR